MHDINNNNSPTNLLNLFEKTSTIGNFHDDDIWLQLPEFISFLFSYLNLSIPLRIKEQ